jgi:hypothetical protein
MRRRTVLSTAASAVASTVLAASLAAVGSASGAVFTSTSARVTNPWFPLRPGTTYVYQGVKDGVSAVDILQVTHRTRVIDGVRCVVIDDRSYFDGRLGERTTDWYAQDKAGNVWYYGEATAELNPDGTVKTTAGSFQAGKNGARGGIFMPAHPRVGAAYQQEFSKGNAEDRFKILSLSAHITTPGGSSQHAMLTKETTPLEPGTIDHKTYVRGIGTVLEVTVKGGNERFVLISVLYIHS